MANWNRSKCTSSHCKSKDGLCSWYDKGTPVLTKFKTEPFMLVKVDADHWLLSCSKLNFVPQLSCTVNILHYLYGQLQHEFSCHWMNSVAEPCFQKIKLGHSWFQLDWTKSDLTLVHLDSIYVPDEFQDRIPKTSSVSGMLKVPALASLTLRIVAESNWYSKRDIKLF